ncbi:MAG: hypothetical protein GX050_10560 [Firmicutes bacterium]|nr:hypothetical protein [Bacillota bacterium]
MLETFSLNGTWELHPVAEFSGLWMSEAVPEEGWVKQEIPAHWQENGAFTHYSGKMVYRRNFTFSPQADRIYRLEIGGVFYKYRAYLNNYALGGREGYFYPACFNITPYLKAENQLLLEVESPGRQPEGMADTFLTGVFASDQVFPPDYNPGGLWQPIRIISSGPAYVESWNLRTDQLTGEGALVTLSMEVYSTAATKISAALKLDPENFASLSFEREFQLDLQPGLNTVQQQFELKGVQLWQTWDLGTPYLYRATLALVNRTDKWDQVETVVGFRVFTVKNLIPYLNGERLFLKGSNYLPPALYLSKVGLETYENEIKLLKQSYQNIVRCYKHIQKPQFYQAMDAAGILVWQDFPLNTSRPLLYLTGAFQQLEEMYRFLGNHPSVVLWTIANKSGYEEVQEPVKPPFSAQVKKLAARLSELDPSRPVFPLSGGRGITVPADTGFHFDFPAEIFKFNRYRVGSRKRSLRFVSWFGRKSYSPAEQDESKPALVSPEEIPASWKRAKTVGELKALSEREQGETLRFYIDRLRFHKYNPTGGMLLHSFRDLQPGLSWSIVDWQGVPKTSFNLVALCYRPVYVFALLPQERYRVRTILQCPICFSNDQQGTNLPVVPVKARLTDPRGHLVWKDQWTVKPSSDQESIILKEVSVELMMAGVYTLTLTWEDQGETIENIYQVRCQ